MNTSAKWIRSSVELGSMSPEFRKVFLLNKKILKAEAAISAHGIYKFYVNGKLGDDACLAPGWTAYHTRVEYQSYDITSLLKEKNTISIIGGRGWAYGRIGFAYTVEHDSDNIAVIADIKITYEDGSEEHIVTDSTWEVYSTHTLFAELYDGETIDLTSEIKKLGDAKETTKSFKLVPQDGELVREREIVFPSKLIITPKGERVIDFGQEIAGYVEFSAKGKRGERVVITHAEVLDKYGNFYTDNLRTAKNKMTYVMSGEADVFKPSFSFQGFRYIRLDEYPFEEIDLSQFKAIAIYSDMRRTGHFVCGVDKINRLYSNIVWGQRGNFIDIPTDCPQRDERLGWTGDAEVFCRTAAINYDVEKFFTKWLRDMAIDQTEDGAVRSIIPYIKGLVEMISSAWADAATICPWEIYRAYGNVELLRENYPMMKNWVKYLRAAGDEEFLWLGGEHYTDWLALDAGYGHCRGATQSDFIASAYYAYSVELVVKAGKILGEDTSDYEELYKNVRAKFRECFMKDGFPTTMPVFDALDRADRVKVVTQTSIALVLRFGLCEDNERQGLVDKLVELIRKNDGRMTTGFVGTPHILHALSDNGRADVAYDLLLLEKNPSWLFSVNNGATTIWEHWDSVNEKGDMWSDGMNSFNHYAYGAVFDWIFGDMVGIKVCDDGAGYEKIEISPIPEKRIGFAEASIDSRRGKVFVSWRFIGEQVRYDITVPEGTTATLKLKGVPERTVTGGSYVIVK